MPPPANAAKPTGASVTPGTRAQVGQHDPPARTFHDGVPQAHVLVVEQDSEAGLPPDLRASGQDGEAAAAHRSVHHDELGVEAEWVDMGSQPRRQVKTRLDQTQVGARRSDRLACEVTTRTESPRTAAQAVAKPAPRRRPWIPATMCGRAARPCGMRRRPDALSSAARTATV